MTNRTYWRCAPEDTRVWFGGTVVCLYPQPRCDWEGCTEQAFPNVKTCARHAISDARSYLYETDDRATYRHAAVALLAAVGHISMSTNERTLVPTVCVDVPGVPGTSYVGRAGDSMWDTLDRCLAYLERER
jgi:hypothetical protein